MAGLHLPSVNKHSSKKAHHLTLLCDRNMIVQETETGFRLTDVGHDHLELLEELEKESDAMTDEDGKILKEAEQKGFYEPDDD